MLKSPFTRNALIVVTTPQECIGLEVNYRDENGIVFPGLRTAKVTGCEFRKDRYNPGWYFRIEDAQFPNHKPLVFQKAIKSFVNDRVVVRAAV